MNEASRTAGAKWRAKDQLHCWYCGIEFAVGEFRKSRDHVIPRSRGGSNAPDNIVFACQRCNGDKGALTLEEYRAVISLRFGRLTAFWGEGRLPPTVALPRPELLLVGRLRIERIRKEKKNKVPPPSPSEEMLQRMKSAESDIDRLFGVN